MIIRIISCLVLLCSFLSFSQEYSISGKLIDINDEPIAYANVVLLDMQDSNPIFGTTTNESGDFTVSNIKPEKYEIKITYLGFKPFTKNIFVDNNIDFGEIVLEENQQELEGVIVIAKRPTVTRSVDRLVFNVENSTLSNSNVLDVLKHTPGVIVHDGSIKIKQSNAVVYMNDKRVYLTEQEILQLLEATTANNIKSIEVITNPPAKYDAEGGAVINIKTIKNIVSGYRGSVTGDYKQGSEYPKYSFGTSHFFKTKKLNTYFNYSISPRKDFRNLKDKVNFIENSEIVSSWDSDYNRTRETINQNINASIDYEIDDRNTLSFSTNMLLAPNEGGRNDVNSLTEIFDSNKVLDSTFETINKAVYETFNLAFTIDYVHQLKKEGEQLSFSAHHTSYDYSRFQDVDTDYAFPDGTLIRNNRFQTISSQNVNLYTGQVDYILPISNSESFEAGLKFSSINSDGRLNQYTVQNQLRNERIDERDMFLYDEKNYAMYSSYSKDWEAWSLKLGLRGEYTDLIGNSLSTGVTNKNDYFKLFPSLYVQRNINENNQVYLNYNRGIYRPKYNELNPFEYFLNDNTILSGNPNLLPQIDDQFILGYTFNQNYTFEVFYRYEDNPNIDFVFQENDNRIIRHSYVNIDYAMSYGLDFTTYAPISKHWNLYILSSIFYNENNFFVPDNNNTLIKNDNWTFYGQVINYFSFLSDNSLTADLSLVYMSPYINGPRVISERAGVDLKLRKNLWNNRASVSVGVTDIFNTQNFSTTSKYLNQDLFSDSTMENRMFTFGFNYKFGNFRLNENRRSSEVKERDRLSQPK
ncbi:outer membrane beta-barrel protein [Algibacter mikhailovii]|uniref:TonB-dependent receptor n=1 Tax=Algibacter mikhailovii TaxID=425498 RepID=A0A918V512_9FLAO|nr:outer membrane beta-barrel protein [Algibacter mikhailovii]GGZ70203.1 TonB-dependent receptor [Algibacter mikhailovii]